MSASELMMIAVLLYFVHAWATGKKNAVSGKLVIEAVLAIMIIAMLDQGETEPIAKGFAWLFVTGAALTAIPDLGKAVKAPATPATPATPPKVQVM